MDTPKTIIDWAQQRPYGLRGVGYALLSAAERDPRVSVPLGHGARAAAVLPGSDDQ